MKDLEKIKESINVYQNALLDIIRWSNDLEDEYGDQGMRARAALDCVSEINNS